MSADVSFASRSALPAAPAAPAGRAFAATGLPRGQYGAMRGAMRGAVSGDAVPGVHAPDGAAGPTGALAQVGTWVVRDATAMATAIRAEVWHADAAVARTAADAVIVEMQRIEAALSPFREDSELARVNRDAAQAPVRVGDELFMLLSRAVAFSSDSDGAFDVTFAAVGRLYDYRRGVRPDAEALEKARAAVGWRHLLLDPVARTVRFTRPGMRIDLGGFAKGHAIDCATAIVQRLGVGHAWLAAGGDSRVIGDRRGRPWTIGVRDPRRVDGLVAVLPLVDVAISTSGDYERFFEVDGERCHHLIDPRTGRSPSDVRSVTVLVPSAPHAGLAAEALSKTIFVLGAARGLAHIERLRGVDAIVVDAAGGMHHSSGLRGARAAAVGEP